MQVVILCGGLGTRAYPHTQTVPKAMMTVGDCPIVEQVMRIYAAYGHRQFILSCGYLKESIVEYFERVPHVWDVQCVDTGDADTGDRILRLRHLLQPRFHATYCDGLGDLDLDALVAFHQSHGVAATVTGALLRSQYGLIYADEGGQVAGFDEKPILPGLWINGGFFVFDEAVFQRWRGQNLEREVLPALAESGQLHMYRHHGFWRSMDTYKDQQELNSAWEPYSAHLRKRVTDRRPAGSIRSPNK